MGELKSADYPTMDDILSNEKLKSSDRLKQKKLIALGCHATRKRFLDKEIQPKNTFDLIM